MRAGETGLSSAIVCSDGVGEMRCGRVAAAATPRLVVGGCSLLARFGRLVALAPPLVVAASRVFDDLSAGWR